MITPQPVNPLGKLAPIVLALSLLGGCRPAEPPAEAGQGVPVKIAAVESAIVDNSEGYVAFLESRQSVELKPRIEGQISRIFVKAGDSVKEGDAIMQIDPRKQIASTQGVAASAESAAASVETARSGVATAQANLENAKATLKTYQADRVARVADLKFNQEQYQRFNQLYKEGATNKQLLDQYGNSLEAAQANLGAVDARIQAQRAEVASKQSEIGAKQSDIARTSKLYQQAQATTDEQNVELQFFKISAPFAGTIGEIPIKEGDFADKTTKLATLAQNSQLEANIRIPTEKAPQLRVGTRVELFNDKGQKVGSSRVFFISPKIDQETQSVQIKALVDNSTEQLRTSQYYKAKVVWERAPGLLVPITAISRIAGQNFIYVAEQGEKSLVAKQKPIKVGVISGNNQQVTDGLKPSDKIITSGIQKIADGAPIVDEATIAVPKEKPEGKPAS